MQYHKIINLIGNTNNPPSKIKAKNCAEVNDDECGA